MSAKLLYNLSDENPNLNKQFGCMNGIFQVFYRQHYPARPVSVSSDVEKSLPPGERKDLVGEINMESDKETERITKKKKKKSAVKDKHRVSSESSSRPSFSSSPRSSSFSSAEVSTAASQSDQPGENLTREHLNAGPMFDIKELVKGSINREMKTRREETRPFTQQQQQNSPRTSMLQSPSRSSNEWNQGRDIAVKLRESHRLSYDEREMRNNGSYKTSSKLKETPRLSLDSRSSCQPDEPVTMSHRRSNSSVVAKLMGLEVIADNFETENHRFCDSPRPIMSRVEQPTSLQRSRSVGSIKKLPASASSKFPLEPAPWKQMKAGDSALTTVYGEIQKRLAQLEFKKAGKDLRALKQILEAMEKTQELMDGSRDNNRTTLMQSTHQPVPAATSPVCNSSLPRIPKVNVGSPRQVRRVTSGKQNAMDLTPSPSPSPSLSKSQLDSTKSVSPKTLRSKQALVVDSSSVTKSGRSQQQSVSPRRQPKKVGLERQSRPTSPKQEPGKIQRQLGRQQLESASPRRKQEIKPRSTLQQPNDLRSLRTDSNISLGTNVDLPELQTPKQRSPDFGIKQDKPSLKPLKVTVEQPSPVSVLDAAFDEEEEDSPSPVRKISLSFKDDDAEESVWIKKSTGVCRSILLPDNNRNPTQPDSDLLKCFTELEDDDHKYISEILLASGLLRDLEYNMISIQLNKARLPINPGLFFILEQNKHRGFRQQQTNHLRRKLIFDTVNEILAQRFTAEGCTKPRLTTANPTTTMEKISKGEQLVKTLCLEIDRLQENNNSQCILEDDKEHLIWNDLQCQSMNMKKEFEGETPGIVLDIERMIFRDLINEVCFC